MLLRRRNLEQAPPRASRDVLRQVRRIELRTRGLVNSRFAGEYHSVFKGQGIEFAEVREYLPGDDVRAIDWNVTARLGQAYVKRYVEERELTVMLVVDLSASQRWASEGRLKSEVVVDVVATLAMSAIRNNDRVGLLLVTSETEWFVPPRKGRRHVLRMVRDLLAFRPEKAGTDLSAGLDLAARLAPHRSILFVFSDFQLGEGWSDFSRALTAAAVRHDVVAVELADPRDAEIPDVGLIAIRDPETGKRRRVNTSDHAVRTTFADRAREEELRTQRLFRRLQVDVVRLHTDVPHENALLGFFRRRERRIRR